ncbi:MAG TPA: rod shape-determining protein MreD [Acidimicrobiales bacterium]
MTGRLRLGLLLLVALILQISVMSDLRVGGAAPDLMLLLAVCAGMADGPETGALAGFAAGLMIDLFLQTTPLGLSALAYCLIGFTVGTMRRTVIREGWWLTPLTALVGSGAGVALFVVIGVMVGQSQLTALSTTTLVQIASIVAVMNAVLAVPVIRLVAWATAGQSAGVSAGVGAGSLSGGTSASSAPAHIRIGRTIR